MKMKQPYIWALVGTICCSLSARAALTQVSTSGSGDGSIPGTLVTVMQSLTGNSGYNVNSAANRVDDSSDQMWTAPNGNGVATMLLTIAGYSGVNTFGIYNLNNPSQTLQIFGGGTGGTTSKALTFNNGTVTVNGNSLYVGTDFGFYMASPGSPNGDWYSVQSQNSDKGDHMVTLTTSSPQTLNLSAPGLGSWALPGSQTLAWNPNSYLLGWEDLPVSGQNKGDVDYQDMLVEISGVVPVAPIPEPATTLAGCVMLLPFAAQALRFLRKRRAV
jgi:hypothetical protein